MATESHQIDYSGGMVTWRVPGHEAGTLTATVYGGGGRGAGPTDTRASTGGIGGGITGVLDLARGTTVYVIAGDGATDSTDRSSTHFGPDLGGQGGDGGTGSGAGNSSGAPGGCASEIRLSVDVADRIMVAGGGGGGGGKNASSSGNNAGDGGTGSAAGGDGDGVPGDADGGDGGTLIAAGAGGSGSVDPGDSGAAGVGGDGGGSSLRGGGGGGGGYFGAGGGGDSDGTRAGPGGGGSSWADTNYVSSIGSEQNDIYTAGYVVFEWEPRNYGWKVGSL